MLLLPVLLLLGLCHTAAASLMHKTEKLAVLTDTAKLSPEDFHSALGGVKPDPGDCLLMALMLQMTGQGRSFALAPYGDAAFCHALPPAVLGPACFRAVEAAGTLGEYQSFVGTHVLHLHGECSPRQWRYWSQDSGHLEALARVMQRRSAGLRKMTHSQVASLPRPVGSTSERAPTAQERRVMGEEALDAGAMAAQMARGSDVLTSSDETDLDEGMSKADWGFIKKAISVGKKVWGHVKEGAAAYAKGGLGGLAAHAANKFLGGSVGKGVSTILGHVTGKMGQAARGGGPDPIQKFLAKANDNLKVVDGLMNLQGSVSMARTAALCHQIAMNQYMADPGCDNVKMIDNVWCHSNPLMEGIMHLNFMTSLPSSGLFGIAGADVKV